jgi:hypothetical protein
MTIYSTSNAMHLVFVGFAASYLFGQVFPSIRAAVPQWPRSFFLRERRSSANHSCHRCVSRRCNVTSAQCPELCCSVCLPQGNCGVSLAQQRFSRSSCRAQHVSASTSHKATATTRAMLTSTSGTIRHGRSNIAKRPRPLCLMRRKRPPALSKLSRTSNSVRL